MAERKKQVEPSGAELIKQAEAQGQKFSENEKAAIEVATNGAQGRKYKLSNKNTQYSEEGFTIAGDQEKELPENPSDQLIARIRGGFIVEA